MPRRGKKQDPGVARGKKERRRDRRIILRAHPRQKGRRAMTIARGECSKRSYQSSPCPPAMLQARFEKMKYLRRGQQHDSGHSSARARAHAFVPPRRALSRGTGKHAGRETTGPAESRCTMRTRLN